LSRLRGQGVFDLDLVVYFDSALLSVALFGGPT
jgi:hypothetical protein